MRNVCTADRPLHASLCRATVGAKGHACLGPKPNPEYSFDLRGLSSLRYLFVVTAAVFLPRQVHGEEAGRWSIQQKPLLPSEPGVIVLPASHLAGVTYGPGLCNRHPRSREENDFWQGMAGNGKALGLSLIFLGKCVLSYFNTCLRPRGCDWETQDVDACLQKLPLCPLLWDLLLLATRRDPRPPNNRFPHQYNIPL